MITLDEMVMVVDEWISERPLRWQGFFDVESSYRIIEQDHNEDLAYFLKENYPEVAVSEEDNKVLLLFTDQTINMEQFSDDPETFEFDKYLILAEYLMEQLFERRILTPLYSRNRI